MNVFLISILALSFSIHAQVDQWGQRTFNGAVQRFDNTLGFGFACNESDRGESDYIDDCIEPYEYLGRENRTDFDHMSEELIFMEATRRTHQLSVCQGRLHEGYAANANASTVLKRNAWLQFQDVRTKLSQLLAEQRTAQSELDSWNRNYNYAEDRGNIPFNEWRAPRVAAAQAKLAEANNKVSAMVARIPMGNRPHMRELYLDLVKNNSEIAETAFNQRFDGKMEEMRTEARNSNAFFRGIIRPDGDGGRGTVYNVNHDLKVNLVQNGQIDHVVRSLGMEDRLARGFVCRTRARYKTGPFARQMLEIPLYMAGGYGLGRLALRAGAWVGRATSAAGQLAARGAQASAWAAAVGLEGYQIADDVRNSCIVPEYLVGSLDTECTPESELQGVYQEASMAQCATAITLGVAAPAAFVGGVVVAVRRADRVIPDEIPPRTPDVPPRTPDVPPETQLDDVVVEGQRPERLPLVRPVVPPSRFPPAAVAKLERTTQNIMNQNIPYDRGGITALVENIDDYGLQRGFIAAYNRVQDKEVVATYMRKLQEDTFDRMLNSGNSNLVAMAQRGELDADSMEQVLRKRVEDRGSRIVVIEEHEKELSDPAFRERISRGFIIDYAGNKINPNHGAFGHLIQQDLTYDTIASVSGKSIPEIMQFLGTPQGGIAWAETFDAFSQGVTRGTVQVEQFNIRFMKDNIPLH